MYCFLARFLALDQTAGGGEIQFYRTFLSLTVEITKPNSSFFSYICVYIYMYIIYIYIHIHTH